MNRDNISALVMAITVVVVSVIVGFTIYFSNHGLNQAWSVQQQQQQQQQQNDKGMVVVGGGVHSTEFQLEKNHTKMKSAAQSGINRPVITAGMVEENHTMTTTTTMKLDTTQFQHIDKSQFIKAPEFAQISGYINTPNNNSPITLSSLRGKVVLLYIWTYTCINSIRPMPYIDDWNQKYSNKGLVIVGVHSPEFQFEKNYTNVKSAVQRFRITYPVILDSDHGTWNAYGNNYWPRFYLIDTQGKSGAGGGYGQAAGNSTAKISDNSLGQDLSSDGSFRIDGQRLYNLAIHNNYAVHYILINVKGKGFQFYTFTFG